MQLCTAHFIFPACKGSWENMQCQDAARAPMLPVPAWNLCQDVCLNVNVFPTVPSMCLSMIHMHIPLNAMSYKTFSRAITDGGIIWPVKLSNKTENHDNMAQPTSPMSGL